MMMMMMMMMMMIKLAVPWSGPGPGGSCARRGSLSRSAAVERRGLGLHPWKPLLPQAKPSLAVNQGVIVGTHTVAWRGLCDVSAVFRLLEAGLKNGPVRVNHPPPSSPTAPPVLTFLDPRRTGSERRT